MVPKKAKGTNRFVSVLHSKAPTGVKLKTNQAIMSAGGQGSVTSAIVEESKPVFQKAPIMPHAPPLPTRVQPVQPVKVSVGDSCMIKINMLQRTPCVMAGLLKNSCKSLEKNFVQLCLT